MKILQLGSGSMGSRRLRDLSRRVDVTLALYDERADRRQRAHERFGVTVFTRLEDALAWEPAALVVSTPPGTKAGYLQLARDRGLHHFLEADIWTHGAAGLERAAPGGKIVSAPSASFAFLPLVKALAPVVRDELGPLLSYQFYMATYMPSWHPTEGAEYYARHRNTAPAREMIAFELQWLIPIFGPAAAAAGHFEKFGRLPGPTEDTWSLSLRLERGGVGQLTITMACPVDYRRGCCFGAAGMATWDIYAGDLVFQAAGGAAPRRENYGAMSAVLEAAYADEINTFVDAVLGRAAWPHPQADAQVSSATLAAAERSCTTGRWEPVDPDAEPDIAPPAPRP